MKLKILTFALLSLGMVGCASQSINQQKVALNQQVYHGYEQLVSKQSYAFDGKIRFNAELQPDTKNNVSTEQNVDRQQRLQLFAQAFPQQNNLTEIERQWMREGLEKGTETSSDTKSERLNKVIQVFMQRYYMSFDGVVDLKHGQLSLNPKFGYQAKNAQGWMVFPLALDLNNSKAYADISALSPITTDPKYDGRYIVFDYADFLAKANVDTKPLLQFLREYLLTNAALAQENDYQHIALSAQDKQAGGVQKIRYHSTYQELMAQYSLFFYLNQNYLKKTLVLGDGKTPLDFNLTQLMKTGQPITGAVNTDKLTDAVLHEQNDADQAYLRLTTAISSLDLDEENIDEAVDHDSGVEAKPDATDDIYLQYFAALKAFDQYKSDQLITAKQLQKIVLDNPQAYNALIQAAKSGSEELQLLLGNEFTNDIVLDAKGRLIRSQMNYDFKGLEQLGIKNFSGQFDMNIHSYGSAKIDQKALKEAVPFDQAANDQSILKLGEKLSKDTSSKDDNSKTWGNQQRYERLAQNLVSKNQSAFETYRTVLLYGMLLEGDEQPENTQDMKDLQLAVDVEAFSVAKDKKWPLTAQQQKYSQQLGTDAVTNYYIPTYLAYSIEDIVHKAYQERQLHNDFLKLRKQGKTNAQIFANLYEKLDQQDYGVSDNENYQKQSKIFANTIGEIAAQDLKTQTIDTQRLKTLNSGQLDDLNAKAYKQVYQLFLKK
ncbi:hypothetical protein F4V57_08950 [Acinetobacter qingfengensis]|uniref:Lipoprotein n=1 Tax=Acinetobacter qingfengensis TaxID=1262585 RepID=A0A1E7RFQ4_9GAMM|nr:hypothetical protein [Acinetobacter qingfengensis]KAA8732683.1 hypothetical protein F4V57_08950 [Acinetobacter qingfengensis]OEY98204.1 hypothetical protein BJI46_01395 [Acinetobacter qingfengensis]